MTLKGKFCNLFLSPKNYLRSEIDQLLLGHGVMVRVGGDSLQRIQGNFTNMVIMLI